MSNVAQFQVRQLRHFTTDELLLSESEARVVLKFIFHHVDHGLIEQLPANDELRSFAQALLVEAIDASYAIGFVEAIFRSAANPVAGATAVLRNFGGRASLHWFRHATARDLMQVKVYQFVLDLLAVHFRSSLTVMLANHHSAFPAYATFSLVMPSSASRPLVWG